MTTKEVLGRRWAALGLAGPPRSPAGTVDHLVAIQAQDFAASLLAVALRSGTTTAAVGEALNRGDILRTHVLRPTWHLVTPRDLPGLLALTASRIQAAAASNQRQRGVTTEVLTATRKLLEKAVSGGPKTRDELTAVLSAAGFPLDENRSSHYLMDAELEGLLCSGELRDGKPTYDLFDRRVPASAAVPVDEAVALLASRFVRGHGPATDRDFSWWSGLALGTARRGLDAAGLSRGQWQDTTLWFDPAVEPALDAWGWLPAFDEYLIAFADRSAAVDPAHAERWVTKNGMFFPVVVRGGRVKGTWKRAGRTVTVEWFEAPPPGAEVARRRWEERLATL